MLDLTTWEDAPYLQTLVTGFSAGTITGTANIPLPGGGTVTIQGGAQQSSMPGWSPFPQGIGGYTTTAGTWVLWLIVILAAVLLFLRR